MVGGDRYSLRADQTYEILADVFGISKAERKEMRDHNQGPVWHSRIQNARKALVAQDLLEPLNRADVGKWKLTESGCQKAATMFTDELTLVSQVAREWPPRSLASDKRLHHMATAHHAGISYLTFGQLWQIIVDDKNWSLFEPYLPPKHNAVAKMEEVQAIRNRVAHFREPHLSDEARIELFLQDFDQGVRRFCARCALKLAPGHPPADPVVAMLSEHWEAWGHGVELHGPEGWLYAPVSYRFDPLMHADLSAHAHRD